MSLFTYFITALVLSSLGSIPVGIITLTITERTINKGFKSGLMIALGATIMEFVYTFIALYGLDFLNTNVQIGFSIKILATCIFFILGFYYLLKKSKPVKQTTLGFNYFDFFRGVLVGALNMLIIPFWIFLALWLKTQGFKFSDNTQILIFSFGAAIGAFSIFLIYIKLGKYVMTRMQRITMYTNKGVGSLFLILGIYQLIQFF